jgi:3-phenylpropionate/trans-cinnamate dioxygenase ferredoxin reductase component
VTVVIVGAAMGGLRTAEALRKSGYGGALVMMGDETHLPYNRPPLSKDVLSTTVSHEAVAFPVRAEVADISWMLGSAVTSVDVSAHTVTTQLGVSQGWSALVIATGLRPRRLDLPPLAGRHAVRSLDDAIALRAELRPGARVVVAGSGFLGCELAATATRLGCTVTVVTTSEAPMTRPFGGQLAQELRRRLEIEGIEFVTSSSIDGLTGIDSLTHVITSGGRELRADVLVEAIGSDCNTEWLAGTGVDLSDGVLADNALRVVSTEGEVHQDVFVVGDVARFPNPMFDDVPRRIEHWSIPTDTGKRAGAVLAAHLRDDGSSTDVVAAEFAPMPSFWSHQFDVALQAYGLPGLADETRILEGDLQGKVAIGYFRAGVMVGVVGVGLKAALLPYRQQIAAGA